MTPPPARQPAAALPVAAVLVDTPLAHLDRTFDYQVSLDQDAAARPGVRVRVRFAGRLVSGFVVDRREASAHLGRLAFLERVVSPEVVAPAATLALCRAVADRMGGTQADVLRLAVPPRHARVEAEPAGPRPADPPPPTPGEWGRYPQGPALLASLAAGGSPRVVWAALPGPGWIEELAQALTATAASGRDAVVVFPDGREAARVAAALPAGLGVELTADAGPAKRYRNYLTASRGTARVLVGTRAAVFAPVHRLGLVAVWDDGSDNHVDPRAPYPHTRDVALLRARNEGAGVLLGGHAMSVEAAALVASGWAAGLVADRATVRATAPAVQVAGSDAELARDPAARAARLPSLAWRTVLAALATGTGPALIQVPRAGYQPGLSCAACRAPARCPRCHGPLGRAGAGTVPACRWCARPAADWACPDCESGRLRASIVGAGRTAEELGRAFPGVPVLTSGRDPAGAGVVPKVPAAPALVVATPGAEPAVAGGYAAVLLLDAWALLGRPDLRAGEETLRRWLNAAALAAPRAPVVVVADPAVPAVQALVRWDPAGLAAREGAERAALGFPPASRLAALTGEPAAVADLLAGTELPARAERLGPVPDPGGGVRLLVRVPRDDGAALAAALHAGLAVRSARRAGGGVRVQLDPALTS